MPLDITLFRQFETAERRPEERTRRNDDDEDITTMQCHDTACQGPARHVIEDESIKRKSRRSLTVVA